jgi:hypothetical protein
MNEGLVLYTRARCGLCQDLLAELRALVPGETVKLVDVDSDPVLQRRWGLDVPVLVAGDEELCRHRLDPAAVLDWLGRGAGRPGNIPR